MQPECLDRLSHPKMEWYRSLYGFSPRWNGVETIDGKTVIVYCEQGFGDIIQFARYLPLLKERGCQIILHCPEELHTLLAQFPVDRMFDRDDDNIPEHDYHVCSMSLPFVLNQMDVEGSYITVEGKVDLAELEGPKIGIAWEGNPEHSNAEERNCPLCHFLDLQGKDTNFVMLQKYIQNVELVQRAESLRLYQMLVRDFVDTAKLINSVDYVVSVDTSVLHLAGAMGKETYGLFSEPGDPRWEVHDWYPNLKIVRQQFPGDWDGVFCELKHLLSKRDT